MPPTAIRAKRRRVSLGEVATGIETHTVHKHDFLLIKNVVTVLEAEEKHNSHMCIHSFLGFFQPFEVVVSFNNLLQTLNCSVNLLIYYSHCWRRSVESGGKEAFYYVLLPCNLYVKPAETFPNSLPLLTQHPCYPLTNVHTCASESNQGSNYWTDKTKGHLRAHS